MARAENKNSKKPESVSLRRSSVRALLSVCIVLMCFVRLVEDPSGYLDSAIFVGGLLYFLLSSLWLHMSTDKKREQLYFKQMLMLDAIFFGALSSYFFASYTIGSVFMLVLAFQAMLCGGQSLGLIVSGLYLLGAGAFGLIFNINLQLELEPSIATPLLIGVAGSMAMWAAHIEANVDKLNNSVQKLYSDLVLHKVRTYKLSRYVSPTVWTALNQGRDAALKTERKRLTLFFSDIEGFSSLSEELEAETLTELLNTYLTEMVKIAAKHRGTIDKFMGDGLMVMFGDTNSDGIKADALRCISMAIDMRKKMKELEMKWFSQGIKKPLKIRMGVNSGYCTVGTFGTSEYMDYTALGTHVNLASRLESAAESSEILISHETWSLIKDTVMCRDRGEIKAKGFSHPIKVYQVVDHRKEMGRNQSYFEEHMNGFSMHLDLEKLKNYDRERIIEHLEGVAAKLRHRYSAAKKR
ncbi:adenylate/guanylate cyclase domain-containing protein [Agaribacterium haliotis]|uniref:adenylate/guanylate cyclase domain-containing protein n=1 Tax=Agaribacterium haliotis TaxID=2013869 RepID=UPI00195C4524|nr:adenylate/guanylate cyclase domain-containing protein [Agaribacterium haliotis]